MTLCFKPSYPAPHPLFYRPSPPLSPHTISIPPLYQSNLKIHLVNVPVTGNNISNFIDTKIEFEKHSIGNSYFDLDRVSNEFAKMSKPHFWHHYLNVFSYRVIQLLTNSNIDYFILGLSCIHLKTYANFSKNLITFFYILR